MSTRNVAREQPGMQAHRKHGRPSDGRSARRPHPTTRTATATATAVGSPRGPSALCSSRNADAATRARTRISTHRLQAERTVALAGYLAQPDRELVEQVYGRGNTIAVLARITGVRPARLRRRLNALVTRMQSPAFRYVAANHELWPRRRRDVAVRHLLRGESQRAIAEEIGLSLHAVRREITAVHTLIAHARDCGELR